MNIYTLFNKSIQVNRKENPSLYYKINRSKIYSNSNVKHWLKQMTIQWNKVKTVKRIHHFPLSAHFKCWSAFLTSTINSLRENLHQSIRINQSILSYITQSPNSPFPKSIKYTPLVCHFEYLYSIQHGLLTLYVWILMDQSIKQLIINQKINQS